MTKSQAKKTEKVDPIHGQIFAGMSPSEIEQLTHSALTHNYAKNDFIIQAGEQGDCFYIILAGKVKVLIPTRDGSAHKLLTFLGPGDCFGEIALVLKTPRSADVIAVKDTKVLVIPEKKAMDFMSEHKQMMFNLLKYALNRVYELSLDSEISALKSEEKVYYFLKWRLSQKDVEDRHYIPVDDLPSMQEIAEYIGLHRSTVHENMKQLLAKKQLVIEDECYYFRD